MKKYLLIILLSILSVSLKAQTKDLADSLIEYAKDYLGSSYRRAGTGPNSFDCSGFTSFVYKHFGYNLTHSSAGQGKEGKAVEGDYSNLQKGDLVLFSGSRNGNYIGHVGIFIELDPSGESFSFIHSSTSNGVIISHSNEDYYAKRFRSVRRILPDFEEVTPEEDVKDPREGSVLKEEDSKLALEEGDIKIVLFADGRWNTIDKNGVIQTPDIEGPVTLSTNGKWTVNKRSTVEIPTMNQPKTNSASAVLEDDETEAEYYIVKSGDTLYNISKKLNTTVAKICSLSNISSKSTLHIGQKLRVR